MAGGPTAVIEMIYSAAVHRFALVAAAVAAALLAGCSGSGDPGRNGGPSPSASRSLVGACLTSGGVIASGDKGDPVTKEVGCDAPHKLEVVSTGRFPDGGEVPGWGGDAMQAAYADCGKAATAYLGADWHGGWVFLHIGRPASSDWAGG